MTTSTPHCKSCSSHNLIELNAEICLHFRGGLSALDKPHILVFPTLVVCLDCGHLQGKLSEDDLHRIRKSHQRQASGP